jgi:hypothetical protein
MGKIANVVIAKNLNLTQNQVQIQALEVCSCGLENNYQLTNPQLIRGKRIFTRHSVQTTPKRFLFIALLPIDPSSRLIQHLV